MKKGNGYRQLVDRAAKLDARIKEMQAELSELKEKLRQTACSKNVQILQGYKYATVFTASTPSAVDGQELYWELLSQKKLHKVPVYYRPNILAVRKDFPKLVKQGETDKWGRITFRPIAGR